MNHLSSLHPQATGILGRDLSTASAGFCPADFSIAFCGHHQKGIQILRAPHLSLKQEGCSKWEQEDLTFPLTPYLAEAIHYQKVADLRLQASGAEKGFRRSR